MAGVPDLPAAVGGVLLVLLVVYLRPIYNRTESGNAVSAVVFLWQETIDIEIGNDWKRELMM